MIEVCKLVTGEELVAKKNGGQYERPRVFQVVQDPRSGIRVGLIPWLLSMPDATVSIEEKFIITAVEASSEIEAAYLKQTTGLELASSIQSTT